MRVMFNENSLQVASVASLASKLQASSRSASPIRKLQVPSIYIYDCTWRQLELETLVHFTGGLHRKNGQLGHACTPQSSNFREKGN